MIGEALMREKNYIKRRYKYERTSETFAGTIQGDGWREIAAGCIVDTGCGGMARHADGWSDTGGMPRVDIAGTDAVDAT